MIAAAKEQPKPVAAELPPPPALPSGQRSSADQQQHAEQRRLSSPFTRPSPAHDSSMDTSQQRSAPVRSK